MPTYHGETTLQRYQREAEVEQRMFDSPAPVATPKAEVRGCHVYAGDKLLMKFDERSDDYAYTNAREFAQEYNKRHGLS